jgi:hypothetical protein
MKILFFNPIVLEGWTRAIINPIDLFTINDCWFIQIQDIVFHLHVRFAMSTTKLDGIAILFNVVLMTFPWGS